MAHWRCPCLPPFVTRISQTPAIYPAMILYISILISMSSVVFLKKYPAIRRTLLCISQFAKFKNILVLHLHSFFIFIIFFIFITFISWSTLSQKPWFFSIICEVKILDNTISSDIYPSKDIFTTSLNWCTALIKIVFKIKTCVHCSWITAQRLMIHG